MLGRCALRPAVSGGDACEKAEDGCAIRGAPRSAFTLVLTTASSSSCVRVCAVLPEPLRCEP